MPDERPAADRSRLIAALAVLSLLGIAVAGYLTIVHYAGIDPVCAGGGGGCHTVQASEYAQPAGIPVALIGLIGYLTITASLLLRGDWGRFVTAALALAGAGFSLYLSYLELFVIEAICQWCVVSAVLMTSLAVLATLRLARAPAS